MAPRFASDTSVPVERTKAEIEKLVASHGAKQFATGWDGSLATIGFGIGGRAIRFVLTLPDRHSKEFAMTPARKYLRTSEEREKAWEQACRARWRALLLVIKAKLEAVRCGISTIEDEFLAWTVLPSGQTVGDELREQIATRIGNGNTTRLLLGGGA